jgi:hypothetical protein
MVKLDFDDTIDLTLAADEFLLEPLKKFCIKEIEELLSVKNVWTTLNRLHHIPDVAEACKKVMI